MSNKQSILNALGKLSEEASWTEVTDCLLSVIAHNGTQAEFARVYRSQMTADELAEYLVEPPAGEPFDNVIAELVVRNATRKSA